MKVMDIETSSNRAVGIGGTVIGGRDGRCARYSSTSSLVTTPIGRSPLVAITADEPSDSSAKAWSRLAATSTNGSGRSITSPTVRSTIDGSRKARSSRPFSVIEPTKPSSASPSGRSETGSWLIRYSWSVAIASPTRWVVRAMTRSGSGPAWCRSWSRSSTRTTAPVVASRPLARIHSSL